MQVQNYIQRIMRLMEEKKEVQKDIKDLFKQAKSEGYDSKVIKRVIKLLSMNKIDRDEFLFLVDSYLKEATTEVPTNTQAQ